MPDEIQGTRVDTPQKRVDASPRPAYRFCDVSANDLDVVRSLMRAYEGWTGEDLCFQGFDQEVHDLPGIYSPPQGALIVAKLGEEVVGMVCLRPLEESVAEIKRLFIVPEHRGHGIGRQLMHAVLERARAIGYDRARLDTLPQMVEARTLYLSLGFVSIAPYYHNPIPGALYFEVVLS